MVGCEACDFKRRCEPALQRYLLNFGRLLRRPQNGVSLLGFDVGATAPPELCPSATGRIGNMLLAVDEVYDKVILMELGFPASELSSD